jgi:Na+/proline symporter
MVVLCVTAIPLYQRLGVFTAYEFLEQRFDYRARALTSGLFLLQRGLSTGLSLYAPALVLEVMLGWNVYLTSAIIGLLIITYTVTGGAKAVGYTQMQQTVVIWLGMFAALGVALTSLPAEVSVLDGLRLAGHLGRLEAVTLPTSVSSFFNDRYTLLSGLIGGFFLQLSYFGTDQSQVQRYLTAPSIRESRMGLLLNGLIKVPMQVLILFIGVMVFVFYLFTAPPVYFNPAIRAQVVASAEGPAFEQVEADYRATHTKKRAALLLLTQSLSSQDTQRSAIAEAEVDALAAQERGLRARALTHVERATSAAARNDADYVFLTFVFGYLPPGLVGLVIAVIFAASMSSISAALNSLASCTVVDFYERLKRTSDDSAAAVRASRISTLAWGLFSITIAGYARYLGNLIEAVNILGSLFYGVILGIFVCALYLRRIKSTSLFYGALIAQVGVIALYVLQVPVSFLWYNVVGCILVPVSALLLSPIDRNGEALT